MTERYLVLHKQHGRLEDLTLLKEGTASEIQRWLDERSCLPVCYRIVSADEDLPIEDLDAEQAKRPVFLVCSQHGAGWHK